MNSNKINYLSYFVVLLALIVIVLEQLGFVSDQLSDPLVIICITVFINVWHYRVVVDGEFEIKGTSNVISRAKDPKKFWRNVLTTWILSNVLAIYMLIRAF